jgi:hypothetical protein
MLVGFGALLFIRFALYSKMVKEDNRAQQDLLKEYQNEIE